LSTWLALLALGLLLAAPTVSRALASVTPTLDLGAWCTGHGLDRARGAPAHPAADHACGYCALASQSPGLVGSVHVQVAPLRAAAMAHADAAQRAPYATGLPPHSRGPPQA
jgi:hypothetical protein